MITDEPNGASRDGSAREGGRPAGPDAPRSCAVSCEWGVPKGDDVAIPVSRAGATVARMAEQQPSGGGPVPQSPSICPWCSVELPDPGAEQCPSCGAALHGPDAAEVPGVTRVDHEALLRARAPAQRSRGLVGWLSGEYQAEAAAEPPGTFAPPADDVRREMLRLELAALEAEVQARLAEAAVLAATESNTGPDAETEATADAPAEEPTPEA